MDTTVTTEPRPSTSSSIHSRYQACESLLTGIFEAVPSASNTEHQCLIEDARGRLRIWADNVGAVRPPKSSASLDYRLRDADVMRSGIESALDRLLSLAQRGVHFHHLCRDILTRANRAR